MSLPVFGFIIHRQRMLDLGLLRPGIELQNRQQNRLRTLPGIRRLVPFAQGVGVARLASPPSVMAGIPRLMGMLASVLLNTSTGSWPVAAAAHWAACTSGLAGGVWP